jgi:hypothetical protein
MNAKRTIVAVGMLLALGCAGRKAHIVPGYGESSDVFAKQAGNRQPAKAATGLDSQEARIVSTTYRQSLAPKETKPKEEPYIIVAPPTQQAMQPLAPSVPKER